MLCQWVKQGVTTKPKESKRNISVEEEPTLAVWTALVIGKGAKKVSVYIFCSIPHVLVRRISIKPSRRRYASMQCIYLFRGSLSSLALPWEFLALYVFQIFLELHIASGKALGRIGDAKLWIHVEFEGIRSGNKLIYPAHETKCPPRGPSFIKRMSMSSFPLVTCAGWKPSLADLFRCRIRRPHHVIFFSCWLWPKLQEKKSGSYNLTHLYLSLVQTHLLKISWDIFPCLKIILQDKWVTVSLCIHSP